jgi:hypothetical protein
MELPAPTGGSFFFRENGRYEGQSVGECRNESIEHIPSCRGLLFIFSALCPDGHGTPEMIRSGCGFDLAGRFMSLT